MDRLQCEAIRIASKRRMLMATGMDEKTVDRNMLRLLLWDGWTKEQAQQIINKSKEQGQC